MFKVSNYGAAMAVIEGLGVRILTDPWTDGVIYMGCWEREHHLKDPVVSIGPCSHIYISHLHPDHFCPFSLKKYLNAYPTTTVWIGNHCRHLTRMLTAEKIPHLVANRLSGPGWDAHIIANTISEGAEIDTALVVTDSDSAVIDCNDCQPDPVQAQSINTFTKGKHVTALLPYTGAGPWPQCFEMTNIEKWQAAEEKKDKFIRQFTTWKELLHADVAVPFSAGYKLRGPLAELNKYRGIPEQNEVSGATILPIEGLGQNPGLVFGGYEYERFPMPSDEDLRSSLEEAIKKTPKLDGDQLTFVICWNAGWPTEGPCYRHIDVTEKPCDIPHEIIFIEPRLLHGLLYKTFHWNTVEISSALKIRRLGKSYDRRVFDYLNRFTAV